MKNVTLVTFDWWPWSTDFHIPKKHYQRDDHKEKMKHGHIC